MQNKLAFLLIWNVCFKDRYQVCDHLLLVAAFKVTLMHQDSNKIARNWSQFQFAGQFGNYVESIYDNMTINCDQRAKITNLLPTATNLLSSTYTEIHM